MTEYQRLEPFAYVVTSASRQSEIKKLIKSVGTHPFLQNVEIRILSFEEFERTPCFSKMIQGPNEFEYRQSKTGDDHHGIPSVLYPLDPDEHKYALIIPVHTDFDAHSALHEFGHISLAGTGRFRELRNLWRPERSRLSRIGVPINLAERLVFSPEDAEIERTITSSYGERQAQEHFECVYEEFCRGLSELEEARAWAPRLQVALNGFQYSLATKVFGEMTLECNLVDLSCGFFKLSDKYAKSALLSDIDLDRFSYLMKQVSLKEWVVECSNAIMGLAN